MGTQRVQIKGILPWLVCWARLAGTRDFYPALAALVSTVQHIFSLTFHYFNFYVFPSFPASWAGSRAGPPVSECMPAYKKRRGIVFALVDFVMA
jgi:hypothetical protein